MQKSQSQSTYVPRTDIVFAHENKISGNLRHPQNMTSMFRHVWNVKMGLSLFNVTSAVRSSTAHAFFKSLLLCFHVLSIWDVGNRTTVYGRST